MKYLFYPISFFFFAFPVRAEINDMLELKRLNMTQIALSQGDKISGYWDPKQRDCAGFVRFLYRESLFDASDKFVDKDGSPVDYIEASDLVAFNFTRITRDYDRNLLKAGDILVYFFPEKIDGSDWHLMVYLEPLRGSSDRNLAIYHNGMSGKEAKVQKVWIDELVKNDSGAWKPDISNKNFLGFYRWNKIKSGFN